MNREIFNIGDQLTIEITGMIKEDGKLMYQLSGTNEYVDEDTLEKFWNNEPKDIRQHEIGYRAGKLEAYAKMANLLNTTFKDAVRDGN